MSDIEDQVIKAIQSYADDILAKHLAMDAAQRVIKGLADDLASHLIKELGLRQEFGLMHLWRGELDTVTHVGATPTWPTAELMLHKEFGHTDESNCYLGSRLFTEWAEERQTPLDSDLVQLTVEADGE